MHLFSLLLVTTFFSCSLFAVGKNPEMPLLTDFLKEYEQKSDLEQLKQKALNLKGEVVPTLITVMKETRFPDRNRWMATFLLGRIMGKKSGPFIVKFLEHPNWVLRLASLKTLLALDAKEYGPQFVKKLHDDSLIVRTEALSIICDLHLDQYASDVWKMLYQKQNYQEVKGKLKRTPIIQEVIRAVGDLGHVKAVQHLLTMIQKKNYDDLFASLDYSLQKLTGKESPAGDKSVKKIFWSKLALQEKVL